MGGKVNSREIKATWGLCQWTSMDYVCTKIIKHTTDGTRTIHSCHVFAAFSQLILLDVSIDMDMTSWTRLGPTHPSFEALSLSSCSPITCRSIREVKSVSSSDEATWNTSIIFNSSLQFRDFLSFENGMKCSE